MGRKLDVLMGKSFRSSKCNTLLKLTVARIKILRNKRELQCRQFRKDVAQLLQNGQEASARLRVEHIFKEQNTLDAYLLIGGYCEAVTQRMTFIKSQKTCPNDLKESIASLVFAAARCADLPELQDVRSLFAAKYGKEFTDSAVELRPGCGVNNRIIEKLSTRLPSPEVKLRLMKEIASEHGIEWNFEETEAEMLKPAEDRLDGSKQKFGTNQTTYKPEDGTNKSVEISSMSSQVPETARQHASGTYFSQPSHPSSQLDVNSKGEQEFLSSTKEGYGGPANADSYHSNSLHGTLHVKESVVSPSSATDDDPNISEDELYARQGMEGKRDYDKRMKNTADLKQENVKYTDVASAAQAAFESAAYAAAAARAAVELSKIEHENRRINHSLNYSRKVMPENEDELDKAILRERKEETYGVGSGIEETSTRDGQAVDITNPSRRNGENDAISTGLGFENMHHVEKEVYDSGTGEESSEDEASWSKDRSHVNRSFQKHFNDYSDDQEGYETHAISNDKKLNSEQTHIGRIEPQLKRSLSGRTSNSSEQSPSHKASQPLFDDYGDDEGDFDEKPTRRPSPQSILMTDRWSVTEDTGYPQYTRNQRQFYDHDENDGYEKGIGKKEYKNKDSTRETSGQTNLSYGDPMPTEKYSFKNFDLESENEMETLNDDRDVNFQGHRTTSTPSLKADGSYQSPHVMPLKQSMGGTGSADLSTYPGYRGNDRKYEPYHGIKSQNTESQASDDEGVYRYEGDGKLRWHPTNLVEQPSSVTSHTSHYGFSVRTRR